MKSEFSEFSYGFALTFEITNGQYSTSAGVPYTTGVPFFPSLIQEKTRGYDVNFTNTGWPLFLQFKLSDYLTLHSSYSRSRGAPCYRISVHRLQDSDQHNLLKGLSSREPEVYYAAPAFSTQGEFNRYFVNGEVFNKTTFIPLSSLPLITDYAQHRITFDASARPSGIRWHSVEGEFIDHPISSQDFFEHISNLMANQRDLGLQYIYRLRDILIEVIRENRPQQELLLGVTPTQQIDEVSLLLREVRNLLETYFGVILIFLQRSTEVQQT